MKTIRNWALIILILGAIGGGLYLWWDLDVRWRPHVISKHQAEIAKILEGSGWVSPHLGGPKFYMVTYRGSAASARFADDEFSALHQAGVDTRVIYFARPDLNGASQSTAPERATVAELWVNRSWALAQKWAETPADVWTAQGIPPADGDVARSAVVEVGRAAVDKLTPLLGDNGIGAGFPLLIWWTKDGQMQGCACADARTYPFVRRSLGVS